MRIAERVTFDGIDSLFRGANGIVLQEEDIQNPDLGDLRKSIKKVGKKIKKVAKKVGRPVVRASKKVLLKYGPYLAVAAQLLNFIPGLGVAVGAAIQVGHMALKAREAKKTASEAKKLDKQEEARLQAEEDKANKAAMEAADAAYKKGQDFFTKKYGMTPERWATLSLDEKLKFMNLTIYDVNADSFAQMGWPRDRFMALSADEQTALLDDLVGKLKEAGFLGTSATKKAITWGLVGGGFVLLAVAGYILYTRKKR